MNWEGKAIIKGKDEIKEVTPGMVADIVAEEKKADEDRQLALDRKANFERRKIAKENGTPFISIEKERQLQEEQKKSVEEKKNIPQQLANPEIWKALAQYRVNIVGKIDLEKVQQKKTQVVEMHQESIFTNKAIEDLHEQALRILGNEEIDEVYVEKMIEDFIHLYNIDDIEKDIRSMIEKEEYIKEQDTPERARLKKLATILEAILVEGITKFDWLGKKIKILAPSKFDELCHGVDAIVELARNEEANEFLALGIDVSYRSVNGDLFEEKIENLLKGIDHKYLTQIKYFKDNHGNAMEDLYVPKIVVSVDGKTTEDLVSIWEKRKDSDGKEVFKNHTIAIDIIGQIAEQCKLFSAYARKKGIDHVADAYDEAFDLLLKISEEVPEAREALTQFKQSKFVNKIEEIINKRSFVLNQSKAA